MEKNNTILNKLKTIYQKEQKIHNFISEEKIQIFKEINLIFIQKIIVELSNFLNSSVTFRSSDIKLNIDNNNFLTSFTYLNILEILPCKSKAYIAFSSNMLSVIIDVLFGGNGKDIDRIDKNIDVDSSEYFINQKLVKIIGESYSYACKKFFCINIKFIKVILIPNMNKHAIDLAEIFVLNDFELTINNISFYFSICILLSLLNQKDVEKSIVLHNKKIVHNKISFIKNLSVKNVYSIEINIVVKLMNFFVSSLKIMHLSVGNVLIINNPEKIIAYIENKPIFLGTYVQFFKQSSCSIEKFLDSSLDSIADRNNYNMNSTENSTEQDKTVLHQKDLNTSDSFSDVEKKKNIILNTSIEVTAEIGKIKLKIKDFLNLTTGSVLLLDNSIDQPLNIFVNNVLIASGEIVILKEKYGIRISSIKNSLDSLNISSLV